MAREEDRARSARIPRDEVTSCSGKRASEGGKEEERRRSSQVRREHETTSSRAPRRARKAAGSMHATRPARTGRAQGHILCSSSPLDRLMLEHTESGWRAPAPFDKARPVDSRAPAARVQRDSPAPRDADREGKRVPPVSLWPLLAEKEERRQAGDADPVTRSRITCRTRANEGRWKVKHSPERRVSS